MSSGVWFLLDGPAGGEFNMERDWRLLLTAERSLRPFTVLRLYRWERETVSLGKHQREAEAVDLAYCREADIPLVRRPSGGRAVLHGQDVTYALVSNDRRLFPEESVLKTYQLLAQVFARAFRRLGLETRLAPGDPLRRSGFQAPCFLSTSRYELTVGRRKLMGSAQRRLKRSFLQHGSIPLVCDYDRLSRLFRVEAALLRSRIISLGEALGEKELSHVEVARALLEAARETFQVPLRQLAPDELPALLQEACRGGP